jgi:4-amino-4-deoxy-L-arabinose transferase-like glycosyltransferase
MNSRPTVPGPRRTLFWAGAATLGCFLAGAVALALVRRPSCDEAWFAGAGWSLAFRGFMGTPALEWRGIGLDGLNRHTYWIMPLHPLALAGWYKVFGFSLLSTRLHSIFWGVVALLALFSLVRDLTGRPGLAWGAAFLASTDYAFLRGASDGRMDMMTLALGLLGLAVYRRMSGQHFRWALLLSEFLIAAGIFVHPNGVIAFALLHLYILGNDRRRIRWAELGIALLPYLVAIAAWGLYIAQGPQDFVAQMAYNTRGRASYLSQPWRIIVNGVHNVLLTPFGFGGAWAGPIVRLKALILATYIGSCAAALVLPRIRRQPGTLPFLIAAGVVFFGLSAQMSFNANDYVIFLIPWFAAITAQVFSDWLSRPPRLAYWAYAVLALLVLLQTGGVAARVRANDYKNEYVRAVRYLQSNTRPDELIMGSAELAFSLGFERPLIDDERLGFYTGVRPDVIVVEHRYLADTEIARGSKPRVARHFERRLEQEFAKVYDQHFVRIYRARKPAGQAVASARRVTLQLSQASN